MSIPPGYRELYDSSGAVIRYRIIRDLLNEDESYIRTAHHALELKKLTEVQDIFAEQQDDGSWKDAPTTRRNVLRLCELGLEPCEAIERCTEKQILPALLKSQNPLVRDTALRLIVRARQNKDPIIRLVLEQLMTEWEHFLSTDLRHQSHHTPPTSDGYAAICLFPWRDEELPRVQKVVAQLFAYAEAVIDKPHSATDFHLLNKGDYLVYPQRMFYELELSARIGMIRELAATRWMYEEMEACQDADGWFRFRFEPDSEHEWYFPLEPDKDSSIDFSFRAAYIFKLIEFDV